MKLQISKMSSHPCLRHVYADEDTPALAHCCLIIEYTYDGSGRLEAVAKKRAGAEGWKEEPLQAKDRSSPRLGSADTAEQLILRRLEKSRANAIPVTSLHLMLAL